jgi:hypothetical protein
VAGTRRGVLQTARLDAAPQSPAVGVWPATDQCSERNTRCAFQQQLIGLHKLQRRRLDSILEDKQLIVYQLPAKIKGDCAGLEYRPPFHLTMLAGNS